MREDRRRSDYGLLSEILDESIIIAVLDDSAFAATGSVVANR